MANHNKKTYATILTAIKLVVILGINVFIYFKLKDEKNINKAFMDATLKALSEQWYFLVIVVILMPVNWLLEAKKWMVLARPIQKLSILESLKGVLAGLSVGFITPHGIGTYVGRVMILENKKRNRLIGAVLLGRILQLFATLLFGALGVYYLLGYQILGLYFILLSCLLIAVVIILNINGSINIRWVQRAYDYVKIIREYSLKEISKITLIACLRYIVFAVQFTIVLGMFIQTDFLLNAAGSTWILLAKSILPTFNFLSDLGIREFSAIYFFEKFGVPLVPVVSASLLVWVINILVPTLLGAPLVMKLKFKV